MQILRTTLEEAGGGNKVLVLAVDGSFCNRTVFAASIPGVELIARTRKDAVLCFPASPGSRRFYGLPKFTPEQVRQDETILWKTTKLFYGGKRRKIRYEVFVCCSIKAPRLTQKCHAKQAIEGRLPKDGAPLS
jgi:hypothetical protein